MASDKEDADRFRLKQAQKLLDLFQNAKGRPAETVEELVEWSGSDEGEAAQAYDLTPAGKIIPD